MILNMKGSFDGTSVKRSGETSLKFRIPLSHLPDAVKIVLMMQDTLKVRIALDDKSIVECGKWVFGGLRIDGAGESSIALNSELKQGALEPADLLLIKEKSFAISLDDGNKA